MIFKTRISSSTKAKTFCNPILFTSKSQFSSMAAGQSVNPPSFFTISMKFGLPGPQSFLLIPTIGPWPVFGLLTLMIRWGGLIINTPFLCGFYATFKFLQFLSLFEHSRKYCNLPTKLDWTNYLISKCCKSLIFIVKFAKSYILEIKKGKLQQPIKGKD